MAPTGQAAQVAHKATGLPTSTIHRALHIVVDKNMETDTLITCDCVVIDEFSMVGINLAPFYSLLLPAAPRRLLWATSTSCPVLTLAMYSRTSLSRGPSQWSPECGQASRSWLRRPL